MEGHRVTFRNYISYATAVVASIQRVTNCKLAPNDNEFMQWFLFSKLHLKVVQVNLCTIYHSHRS